MKKQLRSLLLIAIAIISNPWTIQAQNPYDNLIFPFANDSLVYEDYENSAWVIDSRQKYVLYPDRRPDMMLLYSGTSNTSYMFDYLWTSNNLLEGFDLKFNLGGQLLSINELRLIRDAQGNVIEEITQELDQPGSPLVNNSRVLYTYNAQNKLILEISQDWDDNVTPAVWVNNSKSVYTYDANGKLATQLDSFWSTNNGYFFQNKFVFDYNANGKPSFKYTRNQSDVETGRTTYTYNAANVLIEEKFETKDGSNYALNRKDSINLDSDNRIVSEFVYSFDFTLNKVLLNSRMNALGSAVGIFSESKLFKNLIAYPNPTNGVLTFKLRANNESDVEVFNILGEKVMETSLSKFEKSIDLSSLQNGIYTIKVKSGADVYKNKVVLSK